MKIRKYKLTFEDIQTLTTPHGSKILSVQMQNNEICVWIGVDEEESRSTLRHFYVIVGEQKIQNKISPEWYVGTCHSQDGTDWHVFCEGTFGFEVTYNPFDPRLSRNIQ
jgi:hypothetical protein